MKSKQLLSLPSLRSLRLILPLLCASVVNLHAGTISGVVRNQNTGALLQGASVEIAPLNLTLATDNLGRFSALNIRPGDYRVTVTYPDLNPLTLNVSISSDAPEASLEFPLDSEIYTLSTFTVSAAREGHAAALARQRTSDSLKNVLSLDAIGATTSDNPAELLVTLPGVTAETEGEITTISIRGIDSSRNTVTYDGAQMATSAGTGSRSFRFLNINASAFEELEVIKAPTPDIAANSLGGTVNFKTKSTLDMPADLRLDYRAAARFFPSFTDASKRLTDLHPFSPLFSFDYRQIFSFLGERNLGVSLNLFHNNLASNWLSVGADYGPTETGRGNLDDANAFAYSWRASDGLSFRYHTSATLRLDYLLAENHRFYLTTMWSRALDWLKPGHETLLANYYGGITRNASGGYVNILTNDLSDSRYTYNVSTPAAPNASYTRFNSGLFSIYHDWPAFEDRQYRAQFGGEHTLKNLAFNYDFALSRSSVDLGTRQNENWANKRLWAYNNNVAADLYLDDPEHPDIQPYGANDPTDPRTYAENFHYISRDGTRHGSNYSAKLNARTNLQIGIPLQLTTGLAFNRNQLAQTGRNAQYRPNTTITLDNGSTISRADFVASMVNPSLTTDPSLGAFSASLPRWDMAALANDFDQNPDHWIRDHVDYYEGFYLDRSDTRDLTEEVSAFYLMARAKIKNLGILAGARIERTQVSGWGWERKFATTTVNNYQYSVTGTGNDVALYPYETAVLRINDEYGDAPKHIHTQYSKVFPGLHLTYNFHKKLLARASFSTSIGRPAPNNLIPGFSYDTASYTISSSNEDLLPEYARNIDLSLEYYLPSASSITLGGFRKEIKDFIYWGELGPITDQSSPFFGWSERSVMNGAKATIHGIELAYNHLFDFRSLPPWLRGLRLTVSYTKLFLSGDYGLNDTRVSSTKEIPNFTPQSLYVALNYRYYKLFFRIAANYKDDTLAGFSSDPARLTYRRHRTYVDANIGYDFSHWLSVNLIVGNLFDAKWVMWRGKESRVTSVSRTGLIPMLSLTGRF